VAFACERHPKDLRLAFTYSDRTGTKGGRSRLADGIARTGNAWSGEFRGLRISYRLAAEDAGNTACETTSEELEQLAT